MADRCNELIEGFPRFRGSIWHFMLFSIFVYWIDFFIKFLVREQFRKRARKISEGLSSYGIVTSCEVLVCIREGNTNRIMFWNPLTGETKMVSEPPIKIPTCYYNYGLGYDSSVDDYKLVRVCQWAMRELEVRVYSLRTHCWSRIRDFPYRICTLHPGVFVNGGALYWNVCTSNSSKPRKIASFDLAKEEFGLLDAPKLGSLNCYIEIGVLDEKLCAYYPGPKGSTLCLMNENDNPKSWTRYAFNILGISSLNTRGWTSLCMMNNGTEVLAAIDRNKLGVYHLTNQMFWRLEIPGLPKNFYTITFSESLISPKYRSVLVGIGDTGQHQRYWSVSVLVSTGWLWHITFYNPTLYTSSHIEIV
ncbi:F-box/kelch-repeat protein At3g06240-like [Actinidia eriantha]|uniref:F-box/kelch-repeat protein At3g06240-like n=1 Tax=Actinidia eriantha TaxID=165200 RepID=UPI00258F9995|nr:F-box/kelch-repeat protein At3g06240-like [Actinidia eriantha]